jgi:Nif-specific regulatory protein
MIIEALKQSRGNQSQAARLLGTTKRIMQYKIQKLGIDPWKFRPGKQSQSPPG